MQHLTNGSVSRRLGTAWLTTRFHAKDIFLRFAPGEVRRWWSGALVAILIALAIPVRVFAQDPRSGEGAEPTDPATHEKSLENLRKHVPGMGVPLYIGDAAEVDISVFATIRYLNQSGLASTYTDATGTTTTLDRRDDLQFQKAILYFRGWLGVPEFRYLTYVWTTNTNMGLGAQVVLAGNMTYSFSNHFKLGAGIGGLPTVRTTRGNFPIWLRQDCRTIADEYFRGSYTSGVWAWGDFTPAIHYRAMIGNNLSQLGIDAGQLEMGMKTYSGSLWWTTHNFGTYEGYGDFKPHEQLAASVGSSFTRSLEDKQSQPGTNAPENSQIRLSDGRGIFGDGVFAPGVQVNDALYRMGAVDGALKYRGYSLEGELFQRWVGEFNANGPLPLSDVTDNGFQIQASAMVSPSTLQLYGYGSRIYGDYGDPWDIGIGANYYPFTTQILRVNGEVIFVDRSPVGYLAYPLIVGADGTVVMVNVELNF